MAAAQMDGERTPIHEVPSATKTLTPPRVLKKRRVRSKIPDGYSRSFDEMALSLSTNACEFRQLNAMHEMHLLDKRPEQEHVRTSRASFSAESDDEAAATAAAMASSSSFKFAMSPPKLKTSKSDGRANVLPSKRRQMRQQLQLRQELFSASTPGTQTLVHALRQVKDSSKPEQFYAPNETLMQQRLGIAENKNTLSSTARVDAAEVVPEQELMSSTIFSNTVNLSDDALLPVAQCAKKQLQALCKRHKLAGRWKSITRSKSKFESFESTSKTKDQYSIMVKMTLPCSLREIVSVFSTDKTAEFHRSMEAIFGDQYVYGVNVRTSDCASLDEKSKLALSSDLHVRRASEPVSKCWLAQEPSSATMSPLHAATLKVNAVTLMQKHHLVWKQQNMKFLDYLEEEIETRSVTRVMQTLDSQNNDDLEHGFVVTMNPEIAINNLDVQSKQHNQHESEVPRELKGIFAGYVIQEDLNDQYTRFFFYATHRRCQRGKKGISRSAVQLLRSMVKKVCLLETVILRRRLGRYLLFRSPLCSDEASMATYCATCHVPFNMLRKKHFCSLCGNYTCRRCSELQDVEKSVGLVDKHRVCVSCVRRVSYSAFNTCVSLSDIDFKAEDDDYDPPIMDDLASNDLEQSKLDLFKQSGDLYALVPDSLYEEKKSQGYESQQKLDFNAQLNRDLAVQMRQRMQLSIENLNLWAPGPVVDRPTTPKESICLLDSFRASHSSTSS